MKFERATALIVLLSISACFPEPEGRQPVPEPQAKVESRPIPESRWLNSERIRARGLLRGRKTDLLVIPLQGGENSFDPIERSLITRLVSDRLMQDTNLELPNPTIAIRVLGLNRTSYTKEEVQSLTSDSRAKSILELHANHDHGGRFEFVATLYDSGSDVPQRSKTWSDLEYSDSRPPYNAIQEILAELVELFTDQKAIVDQSVGTMDLADFRFPDSIEELKSEAEKSPLHSAAYLQLLGMLHPEGLFNEVRNQLFERSLIQLGKVPADDPNRRYFLARALAYLDRRPAAIHALGTPTNTHERALLSALNGNLPPLREEFKKLGVSVLGFMAWRDMLVVERKYGEKQDRPVLDQFLEQNMIWAPFIHRALTDTSSWAHYSAATIKLGLEQLLPSESTTLQGLIDKATVTGEYPDELDLTRLIWRHTDAIEEEKIIEWFNLPENHLSASELDIIDLAKTTAITNRLRSVEDDLSKRGSPEAALKKINDIDSLLLGHPAITLQKGRALKALADESDGDEKRILNQQSAIELLNGLAWTGQMTWDAAEVARFYNNYLEQSGFAPVTPPQDETGGPLRYHEWPMGAAWFYKIYYNEYDNGIFLTCVDYSWVAFSCLVNQIKQLEKNPDASESAGAELYAKYAHRFIGHPQRATYEIEKARKGDDGPSDLQQLQAQIDKGSNNWSIYYALGRALNRRGEYQKAQDVFLSYPGFLNTSRDNAMGNASSGNRAGSMFYWIGQHELALPLLEIAANSGTGSDNSMSAGNRYSLIIGDLEGAETWTAARVRRYQSKYAIRDLQQILHIRGRPEIAWSIFEQAQSKKADPYMWSGALVGHRIEGATTEDIANWIDASALRKDATMYLGKSLGKIKLAQRYLVLAGTMDRSPGPELSEAIAGFSYEQPSTYRVVYYMDKSGPEPVRKTHGLVVQSGGMVKHDDLIPIDPGGEKAGIEKVIESRYEMLADAMSAFLEQNYGEAFEFFNETAHYYYLDEFLPYVAFAAAAVGRADHLPAALAAREVGLGEILRNEEFDSSELGYRFDEDLTYAVLASFEGRHDDAIKYLKQALNNRPYIEGRAVYPYYQVVDLADRLFDHTEVDMYRDYALDLAERHTIVLPMYSWAYFIVAKYSESDLERINATASGLKLDPLSHRATLLPKNLVERARQHLEDHGAPYLRRTAESTNIGT